MAIPRETAGKGEAGAKRESLKSLKKAGGVFGRCAASLNPGGDVAGPAPALQMQGSAISAPLWTGTRTSACKSGKTFLFIWRQKKQDSNGYDGNHAHFFHFCSHFFVHFVGELCQILLIHRRRNFRHRHKFLPSELCSTRALGYYGASAQSLLKPKLRPFVFLARKMCCRCIRPQ